VSITEDAHGGDQSVTTTKYAHELAPVALSRRSEVAIDIELLRPPGDIDFMIASAQRRTLGYVATPGRFSMLYRSGMGPSEALR
jgi:hypothetical protein